MVISWFQTWYRSNTMDHDSKYYGILCSTCTYHSIWIWQSYSIMYHGTTIVCLCRFSSIVCILITIENKYWCLLKGYSSNTSHVLQYHADIWDQLIKDDKVHTISLISHTIEHQHMSLRVFLLLFDGFLLSTLFLEEEIKRERP